MINFLIKLSIALIALNMIQSVLITHSNVDIRDSILKSFQDKPKKEQFKVFHFLFNKKYDLNSEKGLMRYRIFKHNLKFIETENVKNHSYTLGITEFADLSADEFRKTYLKEITNDEINNLEKFLTTVDEDEDEDDELFIKSLKKDSDRQEEQAKVDWTSKLNPPNNQGSCGSCWAFAIVNSIEGNYNIKFGQSPNFSQQQLVDCDTSNKGCNGGITERGLKYVQKNGLAFANHYPYLSGITEENGNCKASSFHSNQVVESYEACRLGKCSKTQFYSMLQKGPLIISMDADGGTEANSVMQHYKKGVLENLPCEKTTHAVVLAGIDSDEKGEYLIARNSWGADWGENGNFRIRRRSSDDTCFMERKGYLPIVNKVTNPVPPPRCMKLYSQCTFEGETLEICGTTPLIDFSLIEGFWIGNYPQVRIFTKENCQGSYYKFDKSIACFSINYRSLVNNVKSILVDNIEPPTGCVWLYEDSCLLGDKVEVCGNVADLSVEPYKFANRTSSFKLGAGIKSITFYTGKNYAGSHLLTNRDYFGMEGSIMNKKIDSIKFN